MTTAEEPYVKGKPHRFKKGAPRYPGSGRKPGQRNKHTSLLKECILMAATIEGMNGKGKEGLTGFLRRIAKEDLRAFAMLLGRVLPLQIDHRTNMRVEVTYKTIEEVRRELEERGITFEAVQRLSHRPAKYIDADPVDNKNEIGHEPEDQ
jgi:hypothetical protein